MNNFEILKQELMKCNNPEEFSEVMNEFRYEIFPCNMNENCIQGYSCKKCYEEWLMKKI